MVKPSVVIPTIVAMVIIGATVLVTRTHDASPATPTHVAAVFFDGVNHGDYRQTCSVWRAAIGHMAECEAYLAARAAWNGPSHFTVVAHSEKGWREGNAEVASVKVRATDGTIITARLIKTRHGWLVQGAS